MINGAVSDPALWEPYRPLLGRVPDGRKARVPLFDPILFGYLSVMAGSGVGALPALYNAIALRRFGRAAVAVALGLMGRLGFHLLIGAASAAGITNVALVFLMGRLLHLGFGILLAWSQWGTVRGHRVLGGRIVPLLYCVLTTFVILQFLLPFKMLLFLLGVGPND
jgi:hypothetical protein